MYNSSGGGFSPGAEDLPIRVSGHCAVKMSDDKIAVMGNFFYKHILALLIKKIYFYFAILQEVTTRMWT